ncbi:glycosyltransferase [Reinekea blandensis]|uniref:SqdX n=1 Tax=Reinekea blandensis MED297 TaxID=314283 RepID=A4BGT6_9GAMM|nr:glycosyltransferase [Reinekea blandensis]EAR08734.1 SqdX [Reinekea sp. MED297] [Reinekea blandensis MED297]
MTQAMARPLPFSTQEARILIISDAAPHRNGVGAYYADLIEDLDGTVEAIERISPEIVGDQWQGGWSMPMPGDRTQKLCVPNAFEMQKALREFQPTVVVIPTPGLFGLCGAITARQQGIPVIVGFHTWFEKLAGLYWNRVQGGLTKVYFEWVHKALFRLADRVLVNSEDMIAIARRLGAESVGLMGTPISQSLLQRPVQGGTRQLRSVLFVGRLAAEKNLPAIVQAAIACPQLTFTLAGDGPERDWLDRETAGLSNVRVLGWVEREQITDLIDAHDALVLPSQVESFGTVAMEAMARQRLVVVTQACGIANWTDLAAGLAVIDSGDQLADALQEASALSEFELYARSVSARRAVDAHIEWNRQQWLVCTRLAMSRPSDPTLMTRLLRTVRKSS